MCANYVMLCLPFAKPFQYSVFEFALPSQSNEEREKLCLRKTGATAVSNPTNVQNCQNYIHLVDWKT